MRDQCAAGRTKPSYCTIVMFIRSRGLFCIEYLIGGAEETERSLARSALSLLAVAALSLAVVALPRHAIS